MRFLPDGDSMKAADKDTIENLGIPSLELMERAARSCIDSMKKEKLDFTDVLIVCGSGNNGGDGFAIARLLKEEGCAVTVFMAGNLAHLSAECRYQWKLFENIGGSIRDHYPDGTYSLIIDAIFGVGLSREVTGHYREVIEWMNEASGTKVAVDIPSGINAGNGCVLGIAFCADYTVTFQVEKIGLIFYPGKEYAGKVTVTDIGISLRTMEKNKNIAYLPDREEYIRMLPDRPEDSNKGTYGRLLVIAGSKGMSGAAFLNAMAAYRMGAGLVQIYTEESNRIILQALLPEAIITTYTEFDKEEVKRLLSHADAVCIGSGLSRSKTAKKILKTVLSNVEVACVIDADGLNLLAEHLKYTEYLTEGRFILTPHMKEMSRLTGLSVPEIRANRQQVLESLTEEWNVTCVLKDSRTLIGEAGKRTCVNTSGCQALAKGGSGDVLCGVIAGLLAQGISTFEAATLGTYIHGLSGETAAREKNRYSILARDLLENLATTDITNSNL